MRNYFIEDVNAIIEANLSNPGFSIEDLCCEIGISRMHLHRKLKETVNRSTSHYIKHRRLEQAKELLLTTDWAIAQIAYEVGFSTPHYFTRSFASEYGMTPSIYRNHNVSFQNDLG